MIEQQLIERALQLTGKTMEDMNTIHYDTQICRYYFDFSIEKFAYCLLSPEFIEKYTSPLGTSIPGTTSLISKAIYDYQSGNEQPLISLLEKI